MQPEEPTFQFEPSLREALAEKLYATYKTSRLSMAENEEEKVSLDNDASFKQEWSRLPNHLKESTRAQVDDIPRKIQLLGYSLHKSTKTNVSIKEKDKDHTNQHQHQIEEFNDQQLDMLSEIEHERWQSERVKNNWQAGDRDPAAKKTPFLVPYKDLEQKWKDVDKAMVECIPSILADVGYIIMSK